MLPRREIALKCVPQWHNSAGTGRTSNPLKVEEDVVAARREVQFFRRIKNSSATMKMRSRATEPIT